MVWPFSKKNVAASDEAEPWEAEPAKALKVEYPPPIAKLAVGANTPGGREQAGELQVVAIGETGDRETDVDIIAIQGLGSNYRRTWVKKDADGQPRMWLREFLPNDIPRARICTFEYPSKCFEDPDFLSIADCGRLLLQSIVQDRCHRAPDGSLQMCRKKASRPIILLGHSFGGLVVKEAIVHATLSHDREHQYNIHQAVVRCIVGAVFLGTPHKGSPTYAKAGIVMASIDSIRGKPAYPEGLEPLVQVSSGGALTKLQRDFQRARTSTLLSDLQVMCFWETKGILDFQVLPVVDFDSATLDGDAEQPLQCNHKGLNKFARGDDPNYLAICKVLVDFCAASHQIVSGRPVPLAYSSGDGKSKVNGLGKWIAPASSEGRLLLLQGKRYAGTCEWIRKEDAFLKWLNVSQFDSTSEHASNSRYLWIYGKPGSGKSVLSSYVKDMVTEMIDGRHRRTVASDQSVCDDKECQVGARHLKSGDERVLLYFSVEGDIKAPQVIASLVDQILVRFVSDPASQHIARKFQTEHRNHNKMPASLGIELLGLLIANLSQTIVIIDGLDECSDRSDLLDYMAPLKRLRGVWLLFLSQDEPVLHQKIFDYCSRDMTIDMGQRNGVGLGAFIKTKVETPVIEMGSAISEDLSRSIIKRLEQDANGMFLWVTLIIPEIKPLLNDEKNKAAIFEKIDRFPRTLGDAYKKMLNRFGGDSDDAAQARTALKWILCSIRPLQLPELRVILALEEPEPYGMLEEDSASKYRRCADRYSGESSQTLREYFVRLLGSLIEVRSDDNLTFTLHPFHSSLSKLVIQDHPIESAIGLPEESKWREFCFTEAEAHENAAKLCMLVAANPLDYDEFLLRYFNKDRDLPFLRYACENWDRHLRSCSLPYSRPKEVIEHINKVLDTALKSTETLLAKLATSFGRIDIRKADQMFQLVALRDCQNAILPAVTAIKSSLDFVSPLRGAFASINVELGDRSSITKTLRRRRTFSLKPNLTSSGIDASLDSAIMEELRKISKESPELFEPHLGGFLALQEATRKLRALSMRLSVKPIRDLISEFVGEGGIHPLPAFVFTTHAMDIFMASAFIPRLRNGAIDFDDQFICDSTNPYFGMLCGVQAELRDRGNDLLSTDFYEAHILPHYRLTASEWARVRAEVMILNDTPTASYSSHYAGALVLKSVNNPLALATLYRPANPFGGPYMSGVPYTVIEKFGWMDLSGPSSAWAKIWAYLSIFNLSPILDLIFTIVPKLADVFRRLLDMLTVRFDRCKKIWSGCMRTRRYALIGLCLYAARCYFFPNYFLGLRDSPISDFKFALNDPTRYFSRPDVRKSFLLFVFRSIVMELLAVGFSDPKWDDYLVSVNRAAREDVIRAEIAFKKVIGAVTLTYARFYGFLYLEHLFCDMVYILVDSIWYTSALYNPASYSWSKIYTNLCTNVIAWKSQSSGPQSSVYLGSLMWIGGVIWRRLRIHKLLRFFYSILIAPPLSLLSTFVLIPLWMTVYHTAFVWAVPTMLDTTFWVGLFVLVTDARVYLPATAVVLLAFFSYQAAGVLDPLDIRRSNRSCQKAAQSLEPLIKDSRPLHSLRWAVSSEPAVLPAVLPNSNLLAVSYRRARSERNGPKALPSRLAAMAKYLPSFLLQFGAAIRARVRDLKVLASLLRAENPDINPQILAQQCNISPTRLPGESPTYRNIAIPLNSPLISGLNIKDDGFSEWRKGRDGDLRDIWRQAVKGGRLVTVSDQGDIVERDLDESTQDIITVGRYLAGHGASRVAICLPNSIETLEALFAAAFNSIVPIILPKELPSVMALQLKLSNPDTLIYNGNRTQLDEIARRYPELKRIIWVSPGTEEHTERDTNFQVGDNVSVSLWHHITGCGAGESPLPDDKTADNAPDIIMFWQTEPGDVGRCFAIPQKCMVAAVGASIFDLPQSQRFKPTDLFLPAEHFSYSYALVISLAALFSNTPIALTPRASPSAELAALTRDISPTIILASSSSVSDSNTRAIGGGGSSAMLDVLFRVLRQMKLDSGVIPPGNLTAKWKLPILGTDPSAPRLVYTSHPLGAKATVLLTRALMWLRVLTGARFIYALTSIHVAGPVTQTGVFDYRHEGTEASHLGPPVGSVELKLRSMIPTWMWQLSGNEPVIAGEIVVSGPAVIGHGDVRLGNAGKMKDDGTLMMVPLEEILGVVRT
ncbi:MAG: hypothetical protein M1839_002993, partial [Geoglossum umbratile]